MQQNNLQINTAVAPTYQHQYGTQPEAAPVASPVSPIPHEQYGNQPVVAGTSPSSPKSPYDNNNSKVDATQFTADANNHIIVGSMMPAIVPATATTNGQQEQYYMQQQYQPQINLPYQPDTTYQQEGAATVAQKTATAVTAISPQQQQSDPLAPTQSNSLGVFHVIATYTPTLSDEIDIQLGDQIEVLVEYDDGWCQGINLTRGQAKGVFPRHCVDHQPLGVSTTAVAGDTNNISANPALQQQQKNEADKMKRVSSMIA
ncbi:hypothetical protein BDF20DRAFT_847608 [Mycotypha africana]|uniref:uncharacterized protein n=1 Tax=Mycotypha africana TaxID=64632 RepID=UPI002301379B|nr:uncharacterized protein BDF20DRAFT_847608 [Mycotypha africana]KAI8991982.1 hypothetical protein BDF20DRAFT_847608 [Mycotypha africana]